MTTNALCQTCGTLYAEASRPNCPICEDPRQWVPHTGQAWTTLARLRASHRNAWIRHEEGIYAIHTEPAFAIGQCAHFLRTPEGNVLWDCIPLIDDATIDVIQSMGGVRAIAISHPHYYSTMAEWSRLLGGVPIYIHEADREWVHLGREAVHFWTGPSPALFGGLTLVHCAGHFDGYQVLHHPAGAIFAGDQPQVTPGRDWVSFLWSYPNMVPLPAPAVEHIAAALQPYEFHRLYGAFGRNILTGAKAVVERSAERYLRMVR